MSSSLSQNDVLIILGVGFLLMWNARKKVVTQPSSVVAYPGQVPLAQVVPTAQANATANVWGAIGQGLSQIIGTGANVAAVGIANTAFQVPTPNGSYGGTVSDLSTTTDGAVLNPGGNISPTDYLDAN